MLKDGNKCTLNNFGMVEDQLKFFGHKKIVKKNHECNICQKQFDNEDYLEFHMK